MAHLPPRIVASSAAVSSTGSPSFSSRLADHPPATLTSDTVVFSHTKAPSRQSSLVAGTASPVASPAASRQAAATLARHETQPQLKKFRVEAPRADGVRQMTVRVMKHGDKLGFGVRHDRYKRLQVSTLQGGDSTLQVGDTLLSVNGQELTGHEFLTVIQLLKATRPGELVFEIERVHQLNGHLAVDSRSKSAPIATTSSGNPWSTAKVAASVATSGSGQTCRPQKGTSPGGQPTVGAGRTLTGFLPTATVPQSGVPPPSIPVTSTTTMNGAQQPRKRARPSAQRAVTMLDDNGQPVNVTALLTDLKKERAEKAALEEKNTGLRKRLQGMLIENDEVRVKAKNKVVAAQEKAQRELAEAQNQLAVVRAQLRLQERGPDVGLRDAMANERDTFKAQVERLKKAEADRTGLLTTRYRAECRIAAVDAQRVLDSVVGMFRTKLRQVGRMSRDSTGKPELEVACDGVRRLAFMKLFRMAHDFAFYTSAAFHSQDPVRHTIEQEEFMDLFGNSLCHEERAGLFYVATSPMLVVFDPSAESVVLKSEWAEQNALRDLARTIRL
ncbi:PDZ domain [Phytophthora cactorum]|nr:PDZ domain [Phytophthora cactorum]